jgi:hypothetical protein
MAQEMYPFLKVSNDNLVTGRSYYHMKKDKIIKIKPKGISNKQYSIFLLELNIMKKAWKPYGVDVDISAPRFKKIVTWGTKKYGTDHSK